MQARLTVTEFAEKYLDIKIWPYQGDIIAALLDDQTVVLARPNGTTTCKRVANEIIVRHGKIERGTGMQAHMVILDELATAGCTRCGVEAHFWTSTDECEHKLIRESETP